MDPSANQDAFIPICVLILIVPIVILSYIWQSSRSNTILDQWARDNGYQIISKEYRPFRRGPFFWSTGKSQTVYYVHVQDSRGNLRSGWVRCGSMFWGVMSDNAEVRWDQ